MLKIDSNPEAKNMDSSALVDAKNENNRKRKPWGDLFNPPPKKELEVVVCFCKNYWHTYETCWKIHGKQSNWNEKRKKGQQPWEPGFSVYQWKTRAEIFSRNAINHNWTTSQIFNFKSVNLTLPLPLLLFPNMNVPSDSTGISSWIIDSGASDHMAWDSHFSRLTFLLQGNKKVKVADSSFQAIAGKRTVKLPLFFWLF